MDRYALNVFNRHTRIPPQGTMQFVLWFLWEVTKRVILVLWIAMVPFAIWAVISIATTGGWWIPAGEEYGKDGGYWLLWAPQEPKNHI
jgi:hypothetical protein